MTQPKRWRLECGDALHLIPQERDDSVDALITDPPYSSGGQFRGDRARLARHDRPTRKAA